MARGKSIKLAPFQKLLTIMISGKLITLEEIDALLGKEIYMYRISTYMWHIKTNANGVVKSIKDGRRVTGYQLLNLKEVKEYMTRVGINTSGFTPGSVEKKPSISKLSDLNATKIVKPKVEEVKDVTEVPVEDNSTLEDTIVDGTNEIEITEITENQ